MYLYFYIKRMSLEIEQSSFDWGGQNSSNIIISTLDENEQDTYIEQNPKKYLRIQSGERKALNPIQYTYLKLKSGEEFNFEEDDYKHLVLNEKILENKLIRNIISRIPFKMSDRLEYLGDFVEEEVDNLDEPKRYEGCLRDLVYEAYIKEWRMRTIFRKVLILWRIYKMNKTCNTDRDPITLAPIEKKVILYDWENKTKFIFEAKSIANLIESQLGYQEFGFPSPINPKNPLNNIEFTYKQLISIYNQLKEYGELKWGFVTLRQFNFNKYRWHHYHRSALTVNAIKANIILLDNADARDIFSDFIFSKMDDLNLRTTQYVIDAYLKAILIVPNHWYLEKFKSVAIQYFEAEHFGNNKTRTINERCLKLFRKQGFFLKDLINKKII